jgi:hypothetical protein
MVITGGILGFYGKLGLFVAPAALTAACGGLAAFGRDGTTTRRQRR